MSVERQEETNIAQLGHVAMWIETAHWSDAARADGRDAGIPSGEDRTASDVALHRACGLHVVSRCDVAVDSDTTDDPAPSSGSWTLLVALGRGTIETESPDVKEWANWRGASEDPKTDGRFRRQR
ncbi:hypothetical protein B0H14DRAFT_2627926 [Mycena olivaceomarginata]|nr:hypothetical protein B0H14DRAFT_2627926 [Mycena olivaceomarginata]